MVTSEEPHGACFIKPVRRGEGNLFDKIKFNRGLCFIQYVKYTGEHGCNTVCILRQILSVEIAPLQALFYDERV
jgi:hypothetical protein